jgi:hypothetical protein
MAEELLASEVGIFSLELIVSQSVACVLHLRCSCKVMSLSNISVIIVLL